MDPRPQHVRAYPWRLAGRHLEGLVGRQSAYHTDVHIAIAPVTLGSGEHLLHGIDTPGLGYACTEHVTTDHATHFVLTKQR
jgi:hypothetical protein